MISREERRNLQLAAGVSGTVYCFVMPETETALDRVLDGGVRHDIIRVAIHDAIAQGKGNDEAALTGAVDAALRKARDGVHSMYRKAWLGAQDTLQNEFFDTWRDWVKPVVTVNPVEFPNAYPLSGSSEGLRTAVQAYGNRARIEGFAPVIHTFSCEYEGYDRYAAAAGIAVKTHPRAQWREMVETLGPTDMFVITQPSVIDGNVWGEYDSFLAALGDRRPTVDVMLDLSYAGDVARPYQIQTGYPNISQIFMSMSKPFGTYYHRIAGLFARADDPNFEGNRLWYKNPLSLKLGTVLMQTHGVHDLPRRYHDAQVQAFRQAEHAIGMRLRPSDVFLLATGAPSQEPSALEQTLTRRGEGHAIVRVCLTPAMADIVNARRP